MNRALITFGTGAAASQLEVSQPTFREYADRHGYELIVFDDVPKFRPASWFKVIALREALVEFDEVLWLDADVLVLRHDVDLAALVPAVAWQAMVAHHTPDGEVPNHGVWFARPALLPTLERMWGMSEFTNHPWWEQAAGCELLGYDPRKRPMTRQRSTELWQHTCLLPPEWNSHRDDEAEDPRFWHASVRGPDRAGLMREKLAERTFAHAAVEQDS